jgi:nucleoside-diphosphate-sugar epimerase
MDIALARDTIGYNPTTSLVDGLKATWDWFLSHQDEYLKKKNYFRRQ